MIASPPPCSASAASRFGKYKDEKPRPIRQAEVSGTEIEQLRRRRDALLSLDPEEAKNVIEFHKGLSVFGALEHAKKHGKLIVPNHVIDRVLVETEKEIFLPANYRAVRTGTMLILPGKGKPFGDEIVFGWEGQSCEYSISFDVPARFRSKRNAALVINHPDFDLEQVGERAYRLIANEQRLHLHERFPAESGSFGYDEQNRLPKKSMFGKFMSARHLMRNDPGNYIGLVARDCDDELRRYFFLHSLPPQVLGVAFF